MTAAVEESPDQKLLAYAEDTKGGEKFTLRVIDIATRKQLMAEPIKVKLASHHLLVQVCSMQDCMPCSEGLHLHTYRWSLDPCLMGTAAPGNPARGLMLSYQGSSDFRCLRPC